MVFISRNSCARGVSRKIFSQQWIWWWDVQIPLNALISIVGCVVRSFDSCVEIGASLELPFAPANSWTASIDFSGVTRLKEIVFRPRRTDPMWIVMALQTIASEHRDLREILIQVPDHTRSISDPFNVRQILGEVCYRQWMDLDRLLVQFWELRAIRPKIAYCVAEEKKTAMCAYTGNLLPEITERGIIELVDLDELHGSRKIRF